MDQNHSFHMKLTAFEAPPYSSKVLDIVTRNVVGLRGISFSIINSIMATLNLKYSVSFHKDNSGVRTANGSWTGTIGVLQREEADMLITILYPSPERQGVLDFTNTIIESQALIFAGSLRLENQDIGAAIKIFDSMVWFGIFASMAVMIFVSEIRVIKRGGEVTLKIFDKDYFFNTLSSYIAAFFMEGTPRDPESFRSRFLYGVWWLVMLVLANGFCGHTRAMMMSPREGLKIQNIEHLATLTNIIKAVTVKGTFFEAFFRGLLGGVNTGHDVQGLTFCRRISYRNDTSKPWLRGASDSTGSKINLFIVGDFSWSEKKLLSSMELVKGVADMFSEDKMNGMRKGKNVVIFEEYITKNFLGNECKKSGMHNVYIPTPVLSPITCFAFRKGLDEDLKRRVNIRIRWLYEGHLIRKWIRDETRNFDRCVASTLEMVETPLTVKDLKALFILLVVCLATSFVCFSVELIISVRHSGYNRLCYFFVISV